MPVIILLSYLVT